MSRFCFTGKIYNVLEGNVQTDTLNHNQPEDLFCFVLLLGTLITIQGRLFTDVYGSNIALSSNGRNVRILR